MLQSFRIPAIRLVAPREQLQLIAGNIYVCDYYCKSTYCMYEHTHIPVDKLGGVSGEMSSAVRLSHLLQVGKGRIEGIKDHYYGK